jgi:hypothetical protein
MSAVDISAPGSSVCASHANERESIRRKASMRLGPSTSIVSVAIYSTGLAFRLRLEQLLRIELGELPGIDTPTRRLTPPLQPLSISRLSACLQALAPPWLMWWQVPKQNRRMEPHCLAGHVGLELRNVIANYPFERPHRFPRIDSNSGPRDYSRLSCAVAETQLGPHVRISAVMPARMLVNRDECRHGR